LSDPNDARTDPLPVLSWPIEEFVLPGERDGTKVRICYVLDDRFPEGSLAHMEINSDGWSIQVIGPDGESLGIWWRDPPASPDDLIYRDT
jgi:hypothetical protein